MTLLRSRRLHTRPRSSSPSVPRKDRRAPTRRVARRAAFAEPYQYYQRMSHGAVERVRERKSRRTGLTGRPEWSRVDDFKWGYAGAVDSLRYVPTSSASASSSSPSPPPPSPPSREKERKSETSTRLAPLSRFQFSDRTHDGDSPKTTRDSDRSDEGIVSAASRRRYRQLQAELDEGTP